MNNLPLLWKLKPIPSKSKDLSFPPLQFSVMDEEGKWTFLQLNILKYMDKVENGLVSFSNSFTKTSSSVLWVPRTEIDSHFYYSVASLYPKEYILFLAPNSFFGLENTMPEYCLMRNPFLLPLFNDSMITEEFEEACLITFTNFAKYVQLCFRSDICFLNDAVQFDESYGFGIFPLRAQQTNVEKQYFILSWRKRMEFMYNMKILLFINDIKIHEKSQNSLLLKLASILTCLSNFEYETEDTARASVKYIAEVLDCYTKVNILDIFAKKSKKLLKFKKSVKSVRFQKKATVKLF
jgi:hypothetical protein